MTKEEAMHFYFKVFKVCIGVLILSVALWALLIHFAPKP
jgi:hypothetical protein